MTPWVRRLIVANIIVFFLQIMLPGLTSWLQLYAPLLLPHPGAPWMPWTPFTYMFAHDPHGLTHIGFNMLALYFFGPRVEERLGASRFLILYFIGGLAGALGSVLFAPYAATIGASGAIFGVMLAFARFWPDAQIYFFFFLPMPAWAAVGIMTVMTLYSGLNGSRSGVADFAHLGGFVGAGIYLWIISRTQGVRSFRSKTVAPIARDTLAGYKKIDVRSIHEVNRDEVNRILDKINAKGIASLTPQEKLFLSNFVPADDRIERQ